MAFFFAESTAKGSLAHQQYDCIFRRCSRVLLIGDKLELPLPLLRTLTAGTLPPDWAASGSFPMLNRLDLFSNNFTGSIPPSWGSPDAFPALETLYLYFNPNLTGSLPASWGANGSFPSLQTL